MILTMNKTRRANQIKIIEYHLRMYNSYKIGIKNLQARLDYMLPALTASYEFRVGSRGVFTIRSSSTEKAALDRLESKQALDIHEKIADYQMIVDSIDSALKDLDKEERDFVEMRYFKKWPIKKIEQEMGYSETSIVRLRRRLFDKLLITLSNITFDS